MCVIYVREDNDSDVKVMITWLVWSTWTPLSAVAKKVIKLNNSLIHSLKSDITRPE